jgi:hypothetical protein
MKQCWYNTAHHHEGLALFTREPLPRLRAMAGLGPACVPLMPQPRATGCRVWASCAATDGKLLADLQSVMGSLYNAGMQPERGDANAVDAPRMRMSLH